jgi:hypothetical protein
LDPNLVVLQVLSLAWDLAAAASCLLAFYLKNEHATNSSPGGSVSFDPTAFVIGQERGRRSVPGCVGGGGEAFLVEAQG